ncbi:MAG: hypothetical protein OXH12_03400, partial [Chloroflexi bacterium]|nr:hypothetical protein [Chloroflexota bacterium]
MQALLASRGWIIAALAAVALVGVVVACGGDDGEDRPGSVEVINEGTGSASASGSVSGSVSGTGTGSHTHTGTGSVSGTGT